MDSKNVCKRIKAASLTRIQQSSANHVFPNSRKICIPCFSRCFINTSARTIFSVFRRRIKEFCFAMMARIFFISFVFKTCVIAFSTAIFGFVCSACNMCKNCVTNFTSCFLLNSGRQCCATFAAINSRIFPV